MNKTANGAKAALNLKTQHNEGPSLQVECRGERSLIDTAGITSDRLGNIEQKLGTIHNFLFGPEPCCDDACKELAHPNLRSLLGDAFSATVRVEHMLDEIYKRLVETN